MQMFIPYADTARGRRRGLTAIGIGFLVLGLAAMVVPFVAATALVVLLGIAMVFWGGFGGAMTLAVSERGAGGVTLAFLLVAAIGLAFVLFPGLGAETLTLLAAATLLMEGIYSILLSLSLRARAIAWGAFFASGAAALVVGFVILLGWPGTAGWMLGVALGANFLSTGLALLLLGR